MNLCSEVRKVAAQAHHTFRIKELQWDHFYLKTTLTNPLSEKLTQIKTVTCIREVLLLIIYSTCNKYLKRGKLKRLETLLLSGNLTPLETLIVNFQLVINSYAQVSLQQLGYIKDLTKLRNYITKNK